MALIMRVSDEGQLDADAMRFDCQYRQIAAPVLTAEIANAGSLKHECDGSTAASHPRDVSQVRHLRPSLK